MPSNSPLKKLSVIIPARNEEEAIQLTLSNLYQELSSHQIPHEIIVVDDGSSDATSQILRENKNVIPTVQTFFNPGPNGFGHTVIFGIDRMNGDAAVIFSADESDDPKDVITYWEKLNEGFDCVFGSRFIKGSQIINYPLLKYILNRIANKMIQVLFCFKYNDTTNAFKAYRKSFLAACRPFVTRHYNLTVELPLKAFVRGFRWTVVPITWRNRRHGLSKFKIREVTTLYFSIIFQIWLEYLYRKINSRLGNLRSPRCNSFNDLM